MVAPTSLRARVAPLLFDDAPAALVIAVAAAIGGAVGLHVLGLPYVLGRSAFWSYPPGDGATMLAGFYYYAHDAWHWPIGTAFTTNAPAGANLIYFDSIPLVAVPAKLIAPLFGKGWHPYGLWNLAVYVLQGAFGAVLARSVGLRGLLSGVAVAVLAVSTSVFVLRFYHEDMCGQFVLLWALSIYARAPRIASLPRLAGGWAACCSAALLEHPYLLAMTAAVALAAHLRIAVADRRRAAISAAATVAAVFLTWKVYGYVMQPPSAAELDAFGTSSLNMMSPLVPLHSSIFSRWLSHEAQEATGMQWDGQGFLGFGVIALAAVSLASAPRAVGATIARHKVLALLLLGMTIYALGERWFFGRHLVLTVPLRRLMPSSLTTFRATGRFFWPVVYTAAIGGTVIVTRRFGRRGSVLVACLACLQLADSTQAYGVVSGAFAQPWERFANWDLWNTLLPRYGALAMYPSWYCWDTPAPPDRQGRIEREIEFIAAYDGLTTNHPRTGRMLGDCSAGRADFPELERRGLDERTLYVFLRPAHGAEVAAAAFGASRCVETRDALLCSKTAPPVPERWVAHADEPRRGAPTAP
jgi:hypothetical protein